MRRSQAPAPALDAVVNAQRSLDALRAALASLPDAATPELAQGAMATENAWRFPSGYPDGDRPVDWLPDAEAVLAAAQGHFGVEW